jgi:hypothetical protein
MIGLQWVKYQLPWMMFDMANNVLITTRVIPELIKDTKEIILSEIPVPGLNYEPIIPGGNGNRKVSFSLSLIQRDPVVGNVLLVKQFENLRNQIRGTVSVNQKQFNPNPKVLYSWGTGSVPLVWYVKRVDFEHRGNMVNPAGLPQYSSVEVELWLDENNIMYIIEEQYRYYSALAGMAAQALDAGIGAMPTSSTGMPPGGVDALRKPY